MQKTRDHAYRRLLEQIQQGAVVLSSEGIILYCNRYFAEILEDSAQALVSHPLAASIVADERERFGAFLQTALSEGESFEVFNCQNQSKQLIPLYLAANVLDVAPKTEICLIISDITEKKRDEELLRQSEGRYRTLVNTILEGVVILAADGAIHSCNAAAERILSRPAAQLLRRTTMDVWGNAIHEDGSPFPGETHPAMLCLRTGKAVSNVVLGVHKADGTLAWILINAEPILASGEESPSVVLTSFADISELKRAEAGLAHLAAIVGSSRDAIMSETLGGIITSWNLGAERIFGYGADEVIGKSISMLFPPEISAEAEIGLPAIAAGETVHLEDALRVQKDGRPIYVSITISPIKDKQGNIVGVAKIARDSSERKRAEAQLRHSEASLQMAQRVAHVGSWTWHIPSNHLEWSDEMYRIFGINKEHFTGNVDDVVNRAIHPEDRDTVEKANAAVVHDKRPSPLEYRIVWADGSVHVVWAEAGEVMEDGDGNPTTLTGIVQDITERKHAEERQRHDNQRLEATTRLARAVTSDLDLNRFYTTFVDELRALVPLDRTSIVRLNQAGDQWQVVQQWTRHQPAIRLSEWHPVAGSMVGRIVATATPYREEEIGAHEMWPETALLQREGMRSRFLQPLIIQGQVVGLLTIASHLPAAFSAEDQAIVASIADQLATAVLSSRLYEEVQRYTKELEVRVGERTAQLEAANQELEAFSYSVSHDLRAPLRTVDGFSRILLRDYAAQLPEAAQQQLQRVRAGAQQMGQLIDDLLAFSRMGRQAFNQQPVSLSNLVHHVLDELQSERENRQFEIMVGELPTWEADPVLLKQLFVNLIANAIKFTGRCVVARIEIGCTEIEGTQVIYVKDNGAGFDMAYADKLFGVFQRLHSSEEFPGTGVGLAIVQRIVHRHGGRIWATAEVDKGATFYFTLHGGDSHG